MSNDVYPDQEVWNYIQTELEKRDISLNEIATHALYQISASISIILTGTVFSNLVIVI